MQLNQHGRELIVKDIAEAVSRRLKNEKLSHPTRDYVENLASERLLGGTWLDLDPDSDDDVRLKITLEKEVAEYILG